MTQTRPQPASGTPSEELQETAAPATGALCVKVREGSVLASGTPCAGSQERPADCI